MKVTVENIHANGNGSIPIKQLKKHKKVSKCLFTIGSI